MSTENTNAQSETAWSRTVLEMRELATELEAAGLEVTAIRAGNTAPVPPESGETERFGLVHTVSGENEAAVRAVLEEATVEEYAVHRRSLCSMTFTVTQLTAPTAGRALLIAGVIETDEATELREAASERGEMYTHVQLLDWTHLGSVRHDDPSAFFPEEE